MCEGGVATWNRSSGPSPRTVHQCPVACPIEPWVWRTALGSPVVPELKTRTASSARPHLAGRRAGPTVGERAADGSSRSVTPSAPRQLGEQGDAVAVGHGVDRCGQVEGVADLGRLPGRAQEDRGRPELADGLDGDDELHPVGHHHGDPIPGRHPLAGQVAGEGVAQVVELAEGPVRRRHSASAARSPNRSAARSRPSCIGTAAIGNILL